MCRISGRCLGIVASVSLALLVTGCGHRAPRQYDGRMKYAGTSGVTSIYIDTETGVCYLGANGHYTVMVNQDGTPFIANGWRDNGE